MDETTYPLMWPRGVPRTRSEDRKRAQFGRTETQSYKDGSRYRLKGRMTVAAALNRLHREVEAFTKRGMDDWRIDPERVVVSSNLRVRRSDGEPASGQKEPEDPGVAVYFQLDGDRRCIPCDKWDAVADNIAGVAAAMGALRGLERYVNDAHVKASFTGFAALPDPDAIDWRAVFGLKPGETPTADAIRQRYRQLARERHPDHGGAERAMAELNRARDLALSEVS